jgi:hypothetical protein
MKELSGIRSINEVFEWIKSHYSEDDVSRSLVGTSMADLSVNGSSSSRYSLNRKILWRVNRGRYRLATIEDFLVTQKVRSTNISKPKTEAKLMNFTQHIYNDADKILKKKDLFEEIMKVLGWIQRIDRDEIKAQFYIWGWTREYQIFPESTWVWDAYKDKVAVSVELSLVDAVNRDFLNAILAQKRGELDVLVCVTSTINEPKFEIVQRDIEFFKEILPVPILLIGLTK